MNSKIQAMDEPANQSFGGTQEAHDDVADSSLELLQDKIECADNTTDLMIREINHKRELKDKKFLKEGQTDKLVKKRKNLANILKGLKSQQQAKEHKKKDETLIKINGLYHSAECSFKTESKKDNLKVDINAVFGKLKPFKCSDCTKGRRIKTYFL